MRCAKRALWEPREEDIAKVSRRVTLLSGIPGVTVLNVPLPRSRAERHGSTFQAGDECRPDDRETDPQGCLLEESPGSEGQAAR